MSQRGIVSDWSAGARELGEDAAAAFTPHAQFFSASTILVLLRRRGSGFSAGTCDVFHIRD